MKDLAVLLSTYNGIKYLEEQLSSIFLQDYKNFDLIIRDDGSYDGTVELLKKYPKRGVFISYGENIGYVKSFFKLLKDNINKYDYFAFCDQDDYWCKHKLSNAVNALKKEGSDSPALYFSSYEIVDESLKVIGYPYQPKYFSFASSLVENVVPGCSCVFNKAAGLLILNNMPEHGILYHDWWVFLVVSAFGKVVYDPAISFKYRQHSGNSIGMTCGLLSNIIKKTKNKIKGKKTVLPLISQARLFYESYHEILSDKNKNILLSFIDTEKSIKERLVWFFSKTRKRQSLISEVMLRIAILFQL